uniref:Ras-related protein Rab-28 n=1 Tax=Panagrellus redivivus TaxID=6233 RepID=A0A7E4W770_PANRE
MSEEELAKDLASTLGNTSIVALPDDDSDEGETDQTLKLVVLGDGTTGKTSFCTRFAQKNFNSKYNQIWDIGGQSISAPMLQNYLFGAHAILFVYDVSNSESFEDVNEWVAKVKGIMKECEKLPHFALIGNKTDLEHRRCVRIEKHNKFAKDLDMTAFYVSAKTGDTVDLCFRSIAASIMGIILTKTELESDISIIKAPVTVTEGEDSASKLTSAPAPPPSAGAKEATQQGEDVKRVTESNRQSSVCSIQ